MSEFTYPGYTIEVGGLGTETHLEHDPKHLLRYIDAIPDDPNGQMFTSGFYVGTQTQAFKPTFFDKVRIEGSKRQAWDDLVLLLGSDAVKARLDQVAEEVR